jgi:hypothetical protein
MTNCPDTPSTWGNWFHLLVVAPFLLYEAYNPNKTVLMVAAGIVALVHGGLLLWKMFCGSDVHPETIQCCGRGSTKSPNQDQRESLVEVRRHFPYYAFEDYQSDW